VKIEVFYTPACADCVARRAELRDAAQAAVHDVDWRDINVLDDFDRAVELGVMTIPSIAIEGELVFTSLPTVGQLREALIRRTKARL
jgi:predicted DsbA family dithiol-disulfide isomerase